MIDNRRERIGRLSMVDWPLADRLAVYGRGGPERPDLGPWAFSPEGLNPEPLFPVREFGPNDPTVQRYRGQGEWMTVIGKFSMLRFTAGWVVRAAGNRLCEPADLVYRWWISDRLGSDEDYETKPDAKPSRKLQSVKIGVSVVEGEPKYRFIVGPNHAPGETTAAEGFYRGDSSLVHHQTSVVAIFGDGCVIEHDAKYLFQRRNYECREIGEILTRASLDVETLEIGSAIR